MSGVRLTREDCYWLWVYPCDAWQRHAGQGRKLRRTLAPILARIYAEACAHSAGLADDGQHDDADGDGRARWETTAEAAARLGVSQRTIRRHALTGRIPAHKIGVWLVDADAELPEDRDDRRR